ncbi:phage tail protein I [Novosphingobium sp. SG720]|uniref:phage tail protein I n=1 Tax=Novosphingobium sp. SG720 TaxID=2586998 RepID=UPI00144840B8|nr:phage tail P2-like protein [Novosphingobium sp. SG720]
MSSDSLLPPNSTPLEVALARLGLRFDDIDLPIEQLWDPATCPIAVLPWLAWSLSVDKWDADWSEEQKRAVTARAIADQRRKGSVTAVKAALAGIDSLLTLVEWHQTAPRGVPHTFAVHLPAIGADGVAGGARVSAATTAQIIADVVRVSPARSHFDVVIDLAVAGATAATGAAHAALYRRVAAGPDTSGTDWAALITDEIGEPLTDDTGQFLDGSAA